MSEELGKIHKPEVDKFKGGRKIYLVPLLYEGTDAPAEYKEKCQQYWQEVNKHLENLESKLGHINRVFHEMIMSEGEEGLKTLDTINEGSSIVARGKCGEGADLSVVENKDLVEENMDWERCLFMGFITNKVAGMISDFYMESARKRYEYMATKIDETLLENETAVLFIREGHMVQFPKDMEVFNIAPPALNEIHRWLRDQASKKPVEKENPES